MLVSRKHRVSKSIKGPEDEKNNSNDDGMFFWCSIVRS
jgi:hypothetical protein